MFENRLIFDEVKAYKTMRFLAYHVGYIVSQKDFWHYLLQHYKKC